MTECICKLERGDISGSSTRDTLALVLSLNPAAVVFHSVICSQVRFSHSTSVFVGVDSSSAGSLWGLSSWWTHVDRVSSQTWASPNNLTTSGVRKLVENRKGEFSELLGVNNDVAFRGESFKPRGGLVHIALLEECTLKIFVSQGPHSLLKMQNAMLILLLPCSFVLWSTFFEAC